MPGLQVRENKLRIEDQAAHDWYRFVLSFPPHLVRTYLERFEITSNSYVLDPFCGTGTTLVECKKSGVPSVGVEANAMAWFATKVKVDWNLNPSSLRSDAAHIADAVSKVLEEQQLNDDGDLPLFQKSGNGQVKLCELSAETSRLLLANSISPLPLHKTLILLHALAETGQAPFLDHEKLALAKAIVFHISNLEFGPEVGVGALKKDVPVLPAWRKEIEVIARDLEHLRDYASTLSTVHRADSRDLGAILPPASIDAVITSPPYPNEKDYTRTTRLESVLLGFVTSKQDLRALKSTLIRSNTRGVYKLDSDDVWVAGYPEIQRIAEAIEARRIELGKTSGFERLYARVTRLYFGGMARHLSELKAVLRPGARLAYVVGDQASYLRIMIRTGQLLAHIAESLGYEVLSIDLFRTRLATATKEQLREEVVVLKWPGKKS